MKLNVNFHITAQEVKTPQLGRVVMGLDKPDPHYGVHPGELNWRAKHNRKPRIKVKRKQVDHYAENKESTTNR